MIIERLRIFGGAKNLSPSSPVLSTDVGVRNKLVEPARRPPSLLRGSLLIPQTNEREKISRHLINAISACLDRSKEVNHPFDLIAMMKEEGMKLVEWRNFPEDRKEDYDCAWYVFEKVMKEPWRNGSGKEMPPALRTRTAEFLEERGYKSVSIPKEGDIVAYQTEVDEKGQMEIHTIHFGIYQNGEKGGRVISKFSHGHILDHPLGFVPLGWGKWVVFFRREQSNLGQEMLKW